MHRTMKRVLVVVACGGCLVADSQASSSGWGAAGSTAGGAGGAWPTVPPTKPPGAPDQEQDRIFPPDDPNGRGSAPDGNGNYYNENGATGGAGTGQNGTAGLQRESAAASGNAGFHEPPSYYQQQQQQQQQGQQEHPYEQPPYDPQRSHWAGQQYSPPPHQRQQEHAPIYDHDRFPQNNGPPPPWPDGSDALHVGTKWKSIVSRVKDVVRPGQPMDHGHPGCYQGDQGGGGGGWGNGGGGGSGYPPPDSNWVRGTNQKAEYAPPAGAYGQAQPDAYAGYGHEQQQQGPPPGAAYNSVNEQQEPPPAAGYDPHGAQQGGYSPEEDRAAPNHGGRQGEYHAAPPPAFPDPRGSGPTGAWPPPQTSAANAQQAPNSYGGGGGDPGIPGAAMPDHGLEAMEGALPPPPGGGAAPPQEPPREPLYEPSQAAVGQGWAAFNAHPRDSEGGGNALGESSFQPPPDAEAFSQQGPRAARREGAQDVSGTVEAPAAMRTAPPDEQDATARGQGSEQLPAEGAPWDPPAWMPPAEQNQQGSGLGGAAASDPPGHADAAPGQHKGTPETDAEPNPSISGANGAVRPAASGGNSNSGSYRPNGGGGELDTMPSSADHGMEKVDWGEGAEAEEEEEQRRQEDESGETVIIAGGEESLEQEREEEALIRELERMEGMNGGELLDGCDMRSESSPTPTLPPCECEDEALLDEAVEHRLNDLFDSILDDDLDVAAEGAECIVAQAEDSSPPSASPPTATLSAYPPRVDMDTVSGDAAPREGWGIAEGGASGAEHPEPWGVQAASDPVAGVGSPKAGEPHTRRDEGGLRYEDGAAPVWVGGAVGSKEEGAMMWRESTATGSVDEETAGSIWGKTDRWASLPPHAVVVSESGEGEEEKGGWGGGEGGDEEEELDYGVPLDPIELPPSAATDEIWNDQHLQDQLDAYWEQSRRGGGLAGGGHGLPTASSEVRKLSTYGGHLQPTYGPGDWVGKGTAMVQEPLPGAVDGIGRSSWATPRLFQGSQAPINIYGNIHVHLQSPGQDGEKQAAPSSELSARERYYSQGETSWSGSERGGQ